LPVNDADVISRRLNGDKWGNLNIRVIIENRTTIAAIQSDRPEIHEKSKRIKEILIDSTLTKLIFHVPPDFYKPER